MSYAARLLSWCLLLWLAIFLVKTVDPDARSFYRGLRGREHAWPERFREHARLQRFIALTSSSAAAATGRLVFAYGGDPELVRMGWLDDAGHFMAATKYLLYPARVFTHPTGVPKNISHIAVFQTEAEIFRQLSFCDPVEEKNYLCRVTSTDVPLYRLEYHYQAPDLTLVVKGIKRGRAAPAFLVFAFIFSPRDLPIKESADVNVLLGTSPAPALPGEGSVHRLRLPIAGLPHLTIYRFQILVVDAKGALFASDEHRVVLDR